MNRNILIVLGGGFIIAVLVAIIVQASLGNKGPEMSSIAVAAQPVAAGAELKLGDVVWKPVPKDSIFEGSIVQADASQTPEEAVKGRVRRDIAVNEPILRSVLTEGGNGNVLTTNMKAGMRALAIKVSAESMVGGFINPGDRVDVLLTHEIRTSGEESEAMADTVYDKATETVLENVQVLAIDQTSRKEDDKALVGRTVTLEVDTDGAEKLALVSQMGELSLALRGVGDDKLVQPGKDKMTTDVQVSKALQQLSRAKRSSSANGNIVRVYTGDAVENITVRQNLPESPAN